MPKKARKTKDIEAIKQEILDAALDLLVREGFASLSMRKIASRTSMTAANLYNYFSNKDEIYLSIQTRGFNTLYEAFQMIDRQLPDRIDKVGLLTRAYFDFGIQSPDLYEIMFTRNTPKFTDYIGTNLETAARIEKDAALNLLRLTGNLLQRVFPELPPDEAEFHAIGLWTSLHGIVSLYNSRVLQETITITEPVIEKMIGSILEPFMNGLTEST